MGLAFSGTALILTILGFWGAAQIVLAFLVVAALLESAFAICLGCKTFAILMRVPVIEAKTLTPDFYAAGSVLYQWPCVIGT